MRDVRSLDERMRVRVRDTREPTEIEFRLGGMARRRWTLMSCPALLSLFGLPLAKALLEYALLLARVSTVFSVVEGWLRHLMNFAFEDIVLTLLNVRSARGHVGRLRR